MQSPSSHEGALMVCYGYCNLSLSLLSCAALLFFVTFIITSMRQCCGY